MFRATLARNARLFSTTARVRKGPVETAKNAAASADRTVSDQLVKGIEKGQEATQAVKETAGMNAGEAKGKASEMAGEAKGKANEVAGEAKGKAQEVKGEVKGKM